MIVLYGFLLTIVVLVFVLLSFPVKIRLESTMEFLVQWVFVTIRVVVDGSDVRKDLLLFNRQVKRGKKPEQKAESEKKEKKEKKPRKKIPFSLIKETLQEAAVKKVLFMIMALLRRCIAAIRINRLYCNFGLKDYYWQGILQGAVSGLPYNKQLQVRGNFEEVNNFLVILHISLWRVLGAILIFLIFFPYYRAVRIFLRFKAAT